MMDRWDEEQQAWFNQNEARVTKITAATDWIVHCAMLALDAYCADGATWDLSWDEMFTEEGLGYE